MDFEKIIPEKDLAAYKGRLGPRPLEVGRRPGILVVDMTYAFVDPAFGVTSGVMGWKAASNIKKLQNKAREKNIPIVFSRNIPPSDNPADCGISRKRDLPDELKTGKGNQIVEEIAPLPGDIVIEKARASMFFATNLLSTLLTYSIDTLIITGASTSGCVRATVVDAASYFYYVVVPEECVSDRAELPHLVNLFDMHMKYADVAPLDVVMDHLTKLP